MELKEVILACAEALHTARCIVSQLEMEKTRLELGFVPKPSPRVPGHSTGLLDDQVSAYRRKLIELATKRDELRTCFDADETAVQDCSGKGWKECDKCTRFDGEHGVSNC